MILARSSSALNPDGATVTEDKPSVSLLEFNLTSFSIVPLRMLWIKTWDPDHNIQCPVRSRVSRLGLRIDPAVQGLIRRRESEGFKRNSDMIAR